MTDKQKKHFIKQTSADYGLEVWVVEDVYRRCTDDNGELGDDFYSQLEELLPQENN